MSVKLGDIAPVIAQERTGAPLDNLTLDSIAAERAGMSYGAYKAKHPNTYAAREAAGAFKKKATGPNKYLIKCAWCGAEFFAKSRDRKFCRDDCRKAAENKRYAEKKKAKKGGPGQ